MSQWKGYGPDNTVPTRTGVAEPGPHSAAIAGVLTYEPHYGLTTKPFSLSTDPRTLYAAPGHAEALDDLLSAIRRREGLIAVTGEMGTGKTTLCRAALYQLDRKTFTTFVPDPFLSREDLLRMMLVDFGEISVEDLRNGRLAGASRPDLSYQLYEFLTSLESVDAFAVLVIDEAQHLGSPLLEEIRALSELEAGRRLLQIVLVGQPALEAHLKQPHMRQIDQRVTMRCELKPFSREDITGYVGHRLALAGGRREHVSFSPAALDLVYQASAGIPRVINLVCDRALSRGHLEQVAVINPALVGKAMEDLRLTAPSTVDLGTTEPKVASAAANPFDELVSTPHPRAKTLRAADVAPVVASDLKALMDLVPTVRREEPSAEQASLGFATMPSWKSRVAAKRSRQKARFRFLRTLVLPLIGMGVMLGAGAVAFNLPRARVHSEQLSAHPLALASLTMPPPVLEPRPSEVAPAAAIAPRAPVEPNNAWVVQVAAFASPDRSAALVDRLTEAGMPAYQIVADGAQGALHIVRVGPYLAAGEADVIRERLLQTPDLEGAFVRNVTTAPGATQ